MSFRFQTVALACAATLVSASAFAQVGGGTELPSNARAKANNGAMAKKSMTRHKMMKKSTGKMPGHQTF